MSIIEAVVLGIIQGLSEFLPISSSGHLVLLEKVFGIEGDRLLSFNIALHIATLLPVVWIFRKEVLEMVRRPLSKLTLLVAAGTVPTVVIALLFNDFFREAFRSGMYLGICFITTGLVLWLAESISRGKKNLDNTGFTDAAAVGTAQGIAILPAISRSGMTITGALLMKLDRSFALKFSFLLSIPAILGAALKESYELTSAGISLQQGLELLPLIAGMAAAAISGYVAVKLMVRVLIRGSLKVFSYYVFALGTLVLLDQLLTGIVFERIL